MSSASNMYGCLINRRFLYFLFSCITISVYFYSKNFNTQFISVYEPSNHSMNILNSNRFIMLHVSDKGGLGNQMYRLASLYGIGKVVNRKPSLNASYIVNQELAKELQTLFPKLFDTVAFDKAKNGTKAFTIFGRDCCSYADPRIMHDSNATWLIMGGSYYQSYKYFHEYRDEIRGMFQFGPEVMSTVDAYVSNLFRNDKSHKFCIHIRRDDFIDHKNLESRTDFVIPAAFRVYEFLRTNLQINTVSAVFIGAKPDFIEALNVTQNFHPHFDNVYNASLSSRGEDLAFGATYCDSFLITASGSSFAWWMAYLGKPTIPIFYNGQVGKDRNHFKDYSDYDMFPSEWHKMELNRRTKEVRFEKLWYFELSKKWSSESTKNCDAKQPKDSAKIKN